MVLLGGLSRITADLGRGSASASIKIAVRDQSGESSKRAECVKCFKANESPLSLYVNSNRPYVDYEQ